MSRAGDLELWSAQDAADLRRLYAALEDEDLTGALLAVEGAARDLVEPVRRRLDRWAVAVADRLEGEVHGPAAAQALRAVLVDEVQLKGETEDYYRPRTCHLSAVVQIRRGMPILVSAVWLIVARRAGLEAEGVGLPGHFIARVGAPRPALVDPFERGRPLDEAACKTLVAELTGGQLPWEDDFLAPVSDVALVQRVLRNLLNIAEKTNDGRLLYRAAHMLARLAPEQPEDQLRLCAVMEAIGATPSAMRAYGRVMRRFAGHEAAEKARERLERLRRDPPTEH